MPQRELSQSEREKRRKYLRAWYEKNKERHTETCRKWRLDNADRVRAAKRLWIRKWRAKNLEHARAINRASYERNIEKRREQSKRRRAENPEVIKQQRRDAMRRAYAANPDKYRTRAKAWRDKNPKRSAEIQKKVRRKRLPLFRAYFQNRLDTDPNFKIAHILRGRLKKAVKRNQKSGSAIELLRCTIPDFWIYLEKRFQPGMTRDNHGSVWHLDHIEACSAFDLTKPEQQRLCFHWSNLQPLFAVDNLRKGAKTAEQQLT